ncbi:MAG: Aromatic amino acid beta-eliminating lyase/threonine aldolase [candidate division Zixibacteria bacterium RBG-1]|nr:MAG: Aromatic amino acid beta-eliminating lyase/threonine aldolase [candidate division Zixibacteria bacterium RBG-1]
MKIIDLRSDTVTKPSPAMRKAMASAVVGDDVFEDDPTVVKLEAMTAEILGKEKALFVPSGTMGNEVCIKVLTKPGDEIIVEEGSHIYNNEVGAPAALSGIQLHVIKGVKGIFTAEQIEDEIRTPDVHHPNVTVISVENTHTQSGGTVFPLSEVKKIKKLADRHKIKMHLDGARLWNACVAKGIPPKEYAASFNCLSVCLSKGLGAPIGSLVAGEEDFIFEARRVRKRLGGGMRQVGIIAAAGIYALKNNYKRLAEDHQNAKFLAQRLSEIDGLEIDMETVQTNLVVIDIRNSGLSVPEVVAKLKEKKVLVVPFGKTLIRAVTHLDVNRKDLEKAVEVFKKVFLKNE